MATMRYVVDEEATVRQTVEQVPLPEGVQLKQVKLGHDWEGDEAWRIVFLILKQPSYSDGFIRSLTLLSHEVVDRVTELRFGKYPFVDFEESL